MCLRLVLSLCLLACFVTAGPVPTTGRPTLFSLKKETGQDLIDYDGVYMYKNGKVTKILDRGSALNIRIQQNMIAYLGGKDGIYIYDDETDKLEKYGTINERILGIAKSSNSDTLYIISEDHTVYKVTEGGTKKTKVDGADGARHIELDWEDNLYFIGADKQPYVVTVEGVRKIQGLPVFTDDTVFARGFKKLENGLFVSYNDVVYELFADGSSRVHETTAEEQAKFEEWHELVHEYIINSRDLY